MNCQVVEDTLSVMKKCTEEITLRKSMVSNAFAFRLKNEKKKSSAYLSLESNQPKAIAIYCGIKANHI